MLCGAGRDLVGRALDGEPLTVERSSLAEWWQHNEHPNKVQSTQNDTWVIGLQDTYRSNFCSQLVLQLFVFEYKNESKWFDSLIITHVAYTDRIS